jgi:hypothetical protein
MARLSDLKVEAANFVRETMIRSGQQPSKKAIKQAADQIVKALEPVLNAAASGSRREVRQT